MNDLQIFNNEEFGEIRTVVVNDEPMFCLADICKALELTQPSKVKERLNEKGVRSIPTLTKGGEQKLLYINESNLYKTIFQSRKESAERFTEWVTSEVLPSIRKTGSYGMPKTTGGQIQLLAQGYTELEQKVNDIKDDVSELKENVPLYSCDIDEIQQHVKRRVVNILGGKQSEAYRDNSIRHKTFSDIWTQLKREYGCVSTYKSIKRKYIDDVHEFIDCYVVPKYLDELIHDANAQQSFA
jgi:prophage antirepressor-like protein